MIRLTHTSRWFICWCRRIVISKNIRLDLHSAIETTAAMQPSKLSTSGREVAPSVPVKVFLQISAALMEAYSTSKSCL